MSAVVSHLLDQALLLSEEARTELVEAILERSSPSEDFIQAQVHVVAERMKNVREGKSALIVETEAHQQVLASLKLRQ
ncbi:hypothetical protein SAMN02745166_00382 [Prosthecobacter debontii]|uniref:Addiction module component n=1 Tax=Prosthecobacter debontii TaxID=48467 RepID=A0A1T4WKN7_9BACT|nr:hypothetical protein [Prosthecobacter debontii]SKA77468.1 hypothetical protein SAMN02745166_00382 [Prosthecobacter debontii]